MVGWRPIGSVGSGVYFALEYHTLILFSLKETIMKKKMYFFLPGYLEAQFRGLGFWGFGV